MTDKKSKNIELSDPVKFTEIERKIITLVAKKNHNVDIARKLGLSPIESSKILLVPQLSKSEGYECTHFPGNSEFPGK